MTAWDWKSGNIRNEWMRVLQKRPSHRTLLSNTSEQHIDPPRLQHPTPSLGIQRTSIRVCFEFHESAERSYADPFLFPFDPHIPCHSFPFFCYFSVYKPLRILCHKSEEIGDLSGMSSPFLPYYSAWERWTAFIPCATSTLHRKTHP